MAEWGNTFNLGDTLQTIAMLDAARMRGDYLEQSARLAEEEAKRRQIENDQARQAKLFAARKMMAGDIMRRAQVAGGDPAAVVAQMLPAYQTVYGQLSGGDEWAPSIDEIMAYAGSDEAAAKAREAEMITRARLGVEEQFGETPNAQYRIREREAQRGTLPQGYRFADGGMAERIPGLPVPSTPEQELQQKLAFEEQQHRYRLTEKQAPTYADLNPAAANQKPLTESQDRSRVFAEMGRQGLAAMKDIMSSGYDPTSMIRGNIDRITAGTGPTNVLASGPGQQWKSALNNVVSSLLYKKSGAQATQQEIEAQSAIYAPSPGDDPETVNRKMQFIEDALSSIEAGVPGGAPAGRQRGLPPGARELPDGTIIGPDGRRYRRAM